MGRLSPMTGGKASRKLGKNKSGAKVNFEGPTAGRAIPRGGLENRSTAKSAGTKNVRHTSGPASKGS
jgi:hypothetical protein